MTKYGFQLNDLKPYLYPSDEEIKKMTTKGIHPSGMKLMPPMPYSYYAKMTEQDLDALITYLRTIPPHPVSE